MGFCIFYLETMIFILISFFSCFLLVLSRFYKLKKNNIIKQHGIRVVALKDKIDVIQAQMKVREINLNTYSFQQYNLKDSLVVQEEIIF